MFLDVIFDSAGAIEFQNGTVPSLILEIATGLRRRKIEFLL